MANDMEASVSVSLSLSARVCLSLYVCLSLSIYLSIYLSIERELERREVVILTLPPESLSFVTFFFRCCSGVTLVCLLRSEEITMVTGSSEASTEPPRRSKLSRRMSWLQCSTARRLLHVQPTVVAHRQAQFVAP